MFARNLVRSRVFLQVIKYVSEIISGYSFRMNSCSVPAGRGPALARRTSSKGNQTEFLPSFPLRRIQIYGQNMPF